MPDLDDPHAILDFSAAQRAHRAYLLADYDRGVEVTVTIRNLNQAAKTHSKTVRVSHELAIDNNLETPLVEHAAVQAVREIAEDALGLARHEKREQERLERMLGGPATPARMAAHIATLVNTRREPGEGAGGD